MKSGVRIAVLALVLCGFCAAIVMQQGRLSAASAGAADGENVSRMAAAAGDKQEGQAPDAKAEGDKRDSPSWKQAAAGKLRDKLIKVVAGSSAMRDMVKVQIERNVDRVYADFFKTLTPEQAAAMKKLLAESQVKATELFFDTMARDASEAEKAEMQKKAEAAWKESREQMEEVLGEEGLARLEEYEKSMADRQQVAALKDMLYAAGFDLSDDQGAAMIAMMSEARMGQLTQEEDPELAALTTKLPEERGVTWQEMNLRWQEIYNARYVEGAAEILSPAQLEVFEKFLQQQLDVVETFADYRPQELPEFHDRAEVQLGRRDEVLKAPVPAQLDADKSLTWGDDQHGSKLTASNTVNNTLAVHADAGSGWGCGITFTPDSQAKNSDGSIDASGAKRIVARIRAAQGAKLRLGVIESGADWPSAASYNSVKGADGEAFRHEGIVTVGGWQTYTVPLSSLKLLGGYGNQKGNRVMDMQAVRAVEILYPGGQPVADFEVEWIRLE